MWADFVRAVYDRARAAQHAQPLSQARLIGTGWTEPNHSATLLQLEQCMRLHICEVAQPPFFTMPYKWAEQPLPPDMLELLRAVYGEMVRARGRAGRWGQFDVKNLVLCVCVRITYSPQMPNIKEAHVAEAMGFERPQHTTFRRMREAFLPYLQTPIEPPPSAAMQMMGVHALTAMVGPSSWEPPQQPLSQEPPQQPQEPQTPPHEPPQPPQMWTMDEVLACMRQMEGAGELGQLTEEIPWEQFASLVAMLEREVV